jgi:spore coat protein H
VIVRRRLPQVIAACAAIVSLGAGVRSAATTNDDIRGRDATPDYRRAFPQDGVSRLDLRVSASDWAALMKDMEAIAGPFGQGGPQGAGPSGPDLRTAGLSPDAVSACNGRIAGDACSVGTPPQSGRCALIPDAPLGCLPMVVGGVNQPDGDFDPGELLSRNPIYVPVQITFDGEIFSDAGFRLKGNASLMSTWHQGNDKLPFRLNLDALEARFPATRDQTFFGFPNLTFNNGAQDNSYLRNKIVTDLFREADVPAAQTAFVRVFLDRGAGPAYLGLYTMIEIPDRPMLEHFFGSDDGNLYKPNGTGARWTVFGSTFFPKRTNEEDEDWTDVSGAIAALNASRSDAARWRTALEARLDVDGFLRWLALNTIVGNGDAYGGLAHNYYLYGSPRHRDRLFWIPWDHDLSLRSAGGGPGGGGAGPGGGINPGGVVAGPVGGVNPGGGGGPGFGGSEGSIDLFHDRVAADWPLIRFLMDDPVYRAAYRRHVEDLLATVFVPSRVNASIKSEHARIAPYVIGGEGEAQQRGFVASPQQFDDAVYGANGLLATVESRAAAVRQALERTR